MTEIELASLNAALPVENISHIFSFRRCFLVFCSSHRPTRDNQGGCLFLMTIYFKVRAQDSLGAN